MLGTVSSDGEYYQNWKKGGERSILWYGMIHGCFKTTKNKQKVTDMVILTFSFFFFKKK